MLSIMSAAMPAPVATQELASDATKTCIPIFAASILSNAASIMLIHSHPSGNLFPSKEDTMITDRMNSVCEMVGIRLVDHLIVGGDNKEFFSFKEKGLMDNPKISYTSDYRNFSFTNSLVAEREKGR